MNGNYRQGTSGESEAAQSPPEQVQLEAHTIADANSQREASIPRPPWRPTLFRPEFCEKVVEFCAWGYSLTAFAGEIGVSRDCLTKWGRAHPEFLLALQVAKAAAARWHEDHGRRIAANGGAPGQASMVMFCLRNFAPDDFGENRASGDNSTNVNVTFNRVRLDMTPQEAMEAYMAMLREPPIEG
jgi:hypothetical protein